MESFNLLEKPWISVIDQNGNKELVTLIDVFKNANKYQSLAGDLKMQDVAVMRFLLSILHTVYSRYNAEGQAYSNLDLDEKSKPKNKISEENLDLYKRELEETWKQLWNKGEFTNSVIEYLSQWKDRFYLFDSKYPFYQVNDEIIGRINPKYLNSNTKNSTAYPKLMNRLISESDNKKALYVAKEEKLKNDWTDAEMTRWLITYQGISNASDKVSINDKPNKSYGWLFSLGTIYLSADNLFKTLMLNLTLINDTEIQKPCWEMEQMEIYRKYDNNDPINNTAELYTNWSRLMHYYMNMKEFIGIFRVIKTNSVERENNFVEQMTMYRYREKQDDYVPTKHHVNNVLWKNMPVIINNKEEKIKLPGVIEHFEKIQKHINKHEFIGINGMSAIDNDNLTSRVLIDEYYEDMYMKSEIISDLSEGGWVQTINETIDKINNIVKNGYGRFVYNVNKIRNTLNSSDNEEDMLYHKIDNDVKEWLEDLNYNDNKEKKANEILETVRLRTRQEAEQLIKEASEKDYVGIKGADDYRTIATEFGYSLATIYKKERGEESGGEK